MSTQFTSLQHEELTNRYLIFIRTITSATWYKILQGAEEYIGKDRIWSNITQELAEDLVENNFCINLFTQDSMEA